MGFNEFVFAADTPTDVQGPQGVGAVPSTHPVSRPTQHSMRMLSDREHCPANKQCGRDANNNNGHIINTD